jgi:hypothetical protein
MEPHREDGGRQLLQSLRFNCKMTILRVKKEFLPRRSFLSIEFFLDRRGDPVDLANSRDTLSGLLYFSIEIPEKK